MPGMNDAPVLNEATHGPRIPLRTPAKVPLPLDERAMGRSGGRSRAGGSAGRAAGNSMSAGAGASGGRQNRNSQERPLRPERPHRFALLWRRQKRLLRPVGFGVAAIAVLLGVFSLVRTVQPGSTIATWRERAGGMVGLPVEQVVVEGREKTPDAMLRAALGVRPGDKLLGFSLEAARARIEQLAWVQHATVERRLPGTIVVTLQERRPFAVWQSGGKFVLIDRQGQLVVEQDPVKDATAFATLPLVVGPGAPEAAAALLEQLATYPELRSRVVAAVRVGERRWNLRLHNGADVMLPEGAEAPALAKLMELQTSQQLLDRPLATVDLRLSDRLVVRPAPEQKLEQKPGAPAGAPGGTTRRPT